MAAEDDLRLAWHAAREGRLGRRDALLTLAVADAEPGMPWVERCRDFLVARIPGHLFSKHRAVGKALADPHVASALARLRATFPAERVLSLLMREAVRRGPWTGRAPAVDTLIDDILDVENTGDKSWSRSRKSRETSAVPFTLRGAGPLPSAVDDGSPESAAAFYLAVLLSIAILLAGLAAPTGNEAKAA